MTEREEIPEGTVTVLFTDLVASTELNQRLGDVAARSLARDVERIVEEHVAAHRGVPIKQLGDGVMAAFSSARRAVVCAREIQQAMHARNRHEPELRADMRIGLHTGEVINEDGDLHGETVIIAKRIEGLAPPGGALASETVQMVLGSARDQLVDRGEHELKGIAAPWRLFEVPCVDEDGRRGLAETEPTPYVGRLAERKQLAALASAVARGTGALVLVAGEAGAGKSRLTTGALEEAGRLGMNTFVGSCLDMDVPPPYQPLIDQLDQASKSTTPERMREALGENAPEIATLMPALRERYDDISEPPKLPADQERQYVLHGFAEFLSRVTAVRPAALLFEDLHWADESTLMLLEYLSPRLASMSLLVIGTYRPTDLTVERPLNRLISTLTRGRSATEITLEMLTADEVAEMIAHRAGQPPPPELVELVFSETDGNPFFVEELYRHLNEAGRLVDESGAWRSGIEIGETEVPRGVQRVIERRLDRLDPGARRLLAGAAVIGRTFSFDHLAAVGDASDDELFDALEAAEPLNVISEIPGSSDARYGFVHEQFRQALMSELSAPRRQRIHVRVADALDATSSRVNGVSSEAAQIADHLFLAGSAVPSERAVSALIDAGRLALGALAFEDAQRSFERALMRIGDDADRRSEVMALDALALRGSGRVEGALDALDAALAGLAHGSDTRANILLQRCELLLDLFRAEQTLDDLTLVLEHRRDRGDTAGELAALLALGRARYILSLDRRDEAEVSRRYYEEALALAERLDDRESMVRALVPTAWFTDYWADYRATARANIDRAIELCEQLGDEDLLIEARTARLRLRQLRDADDEADEVLALLEARRDPLRLKEHCFWMMWHHWARGRYERCVEMCDRGIGLAEQLASAPVQYGSIKALALVELGRFDEVADALALEVADDEHPFGRAMAGLARTVYLARVMAHGEAVESAVDTHARAEALSRVWMKQWMIDVLATLRARMFVEGDEFPSEAEAVLTAADQGPRPAARAVSLLGEGRAGEACALLEPIVERRSEGGQARWLSDARVPLAEALLADGRLDDAEAVARSGLEEAESAFQASLIWQYRLVLARVLEAQHDAAAAEAQRMLAFAEVGALADRIADPAHRAALLAQPAARRWA